MKSVITCDMEGVIETINDDGINLFGYSKDELIGRKRVSLFSPGEIVIQNVGMWLSNAIKHGEYNTKSYFLSKDGNKINARIRITPTFANGKNNPQTGYCGVTVPIEEEVIIPISITTKFIKWVFAITRGGFTSASLFPVFAVAAFLAGSGNGLFSPLLLLLCILGIVFLHLSSNLYNDYFDVKHGTDEANTEYFNAGLNSKLLEGAQLSGGSRAIELGLITLKGTKSLARNMLIGAILTASGLMYLSYSITESMSNAQNAAIIGVIGLFLGYFYTAKPIRLVSRRGLGEIAIFLAFGPLLTLGSLFAISTSTIELFSVDFYNAIYLGIPLGLLTTNILYINQFPDANSDSKTGKNHLVVTLGKKIARWGYLIILLGAFLSSFMLLDIFSVTIENFNSNAYLIGLSILFLYGLYIFTRLFKLYESRKLINSNLNTIYLQIIFGLFYALILNNFFI
ncbi:MAG: UbiA family prenyltransferase [Bacteroidota bacterium]|nr:UbiA family prenyltransferase [Bacteroidota bacterium]